VRVTAGVAATKPLGGLAAAIVKKIRDRVVAIQDAFYGFGRYMIRTWLTLN
jgi:hypothetical protein